MGIVPDKEKLYREFEKKFTYRDKQGNPRMNNTAPRKVRGFIGSIIEQVLKNIDDLDIRGASARGYCTERNKRKVLDSDLLEDICSAIKEELKKERE